MLTVTVEIDGGIANFLGLVNDVARVRSIDSAGDYCLITLAAIRGSQAVSWESERGFGLFQNPCPGFGDEPDELTQDVEMAAERFRVIAVGA